jgi:hypothetical protein
MSHDFKLCAKLLRYPLAPFQSEGTKVEGILYNYKLARKSHAWGVPSYFGNRDDTMGCPKPWKHISGRPLPTVQNTNERKTN